MARIDVAFLALGTLCLLLGLTLGIGMGIAHDFQFVPVHAHLNLVGFVLLSIFGLTYKAYPALGRSRLAMVHFLSSGLGALVFPAGIYLSISRGFIGLAVGGSFLVLGGAVLFLANLIRNVALPASPIRSGQNRSLAQA